MVIIFPHPHTLGIAKHVSCFNHQQWLFNMLITRAKKFAPSEIPLLVVFSHVSNEKVLLRRIIAEIPPLPPQSISFSGIP
jgi:hypothetical protein